MAESPIRKKSTKNGGEANALSMGDIKELFVLMRENEIAELQLEQQETKIHIVSKGAHNAPPAQVVMAGVPQMVSMPSGAPAPPVAAAAAPAQLSSEAQGSGDAASAADQAGAPANVKTVFSPMVGTFYSAPAPDAPSFVKVGEAVTEETVLCIIEAMKLMNEIKAEIKGRVYKVLVETGSPVEYNQPLFLIEP